MNRICMYTPSAHGGHALYSWELLTALAHHPDGKDRVELVSSEDLDEQFRGGAYRINAILPPLRHRSQFPGKLAWALSRILHYPQRERMFARWLERRPDITAVHFQEFLPWLAVPLFRRMRRLNKKILYTVHNIRPHIYPKFIPPGLWDHWNHKAWMMCDGLFVLTDALAAELAEILGPGHPPIHVVPHGVWTVPQPALQPSIGERLKWKRLLFFGNIRRNKGVDLLLDALELLPGFSLTIAGEPLHQEYFQDEVLPRVERLRQRGIPVDLRPQFTPDDQAQELFQTHSAIVLPYTPGFRAQSGVIFLALAYDMPVIASEAGGLRDLLEEYRFGATFREMTPQVLSQAVRDFFAAGPSEELVGQMRAAKGHFSWREAAAATLAGYSAV